MLRRAQRFPSDRKESDIFVGRLSILSIYMDRWIELMDDTWIFMRLNRVNTNSTHFHHDLKGNNMRNIENIIWSGYIERYRH